MRGYGSALADITNPTIELVLAPTGLREFYSRNSFQSLINTEAKALQVTDVIKSATLSTTNNAATSCCGLPIRITLLAASGHDVYVLEGGLAAWDARRQPIVAVPGDRGGPLVDPVGSEELQRLMGGERPVAVFDVRDSASFAGGRVPGARTTTTFAALLEAVREYETTDLIVLIDGGDGPAQKFAERLRREGYRSVKYVYGGMLDWKDKGLEVEK